MSETMTESRRSRPSRPAKQIARIAALLTEIEQLSDGAKDMPLPLLVKTRTSIERARSVLQHCGKSASGAATQADGDGAPQPDIDRDVLERMYRTLGAGPRPAER